jgi:hypothetical protein
MYSMSLSKILHPICASAIIIVAVLVLLAAPPDACAREFEASTAPDGKFVTKMFPKFFFTSAYFDDDGKVRNLADVTGLLYIELPVQIQYGITGWLSVGAVVPVGITYQEEEARDDPIGRFAVREVWLTLQHRWLTFPFISSSSLRVKIPIQDKKSWEDGLRIGDGQIDLFPVYHFDYFNRTIHCYLQFSAGYKFRLKKDDYKPLDEIRFYSRAGFELFSDLQMRFFLFADMTKFTNGEYPGDSRPFFEEEGSLYTFGYGMSLWPRPTFRFEISTGGDWSGKNQYRGIRWIIGATKIF